MTSIYTTLRTDKAYKIYDGFLYEIAGDECEEALDVVLPKNIVFADTETCGYTFLLDEEGKVFDEVTFYKFEDSYWIASHKALEDYFAGIDFDFSIKEISADYQMVQVEGKQSGDIAQAFYEYDIATLNLNVPLRYMHTHSEMCDIRDVEAAIGVVVSLVRQLDSMSKSTFIPE